MSNENLRTIALDRALLFFTPERSASASDVVEVARGFLAFLSGDSPGIIKPVKDRTNARTKPVDASPDGAEPVPTGDSEIARPPSRADVVDTSGDAPSEPVPAPAKVQAEKPAKSVPAKAASGAATTASGSSGDVVVLKKEDVQKLVVKLVTLEGRDAATKLLQPFGAGNVTGLDPKHYSAVAKKAQELIDAAKEPAAG